MYTVWIYTYQWCDTNFVWFFACPQYQLRTEESALWMICLSPSKPSLLRVVLVSDIPLWYLGRPTEMVRNRLYILAWAHVCESRPFIYPTLYFFNLYPTTAQKPDMLRNAQKYWNIALTFYFLSGVRTTGLLPRGMKREVGFDKQ